MSSSGQRERELTVTKTSEGFTQIPLLAENRTLNYEIVRADHSMTSYDRKLFRDYPEQSSSVNYRAESNIDVTFHAEGYASDYIKINLSSENNLNKYTEAHHQYNFTTPLDLSDTKNSAVLDFWLWQKYRDPDLYIALKDQNNVRFGMKIADVMQWYKYRTWSQLQLPLWKLTAMDTSGIFDWTNVTGIGIYYGNAKANRVGTTELWLDDVRITTQQSPVNLSQLGATKDTITIGWKEPGSGANQYRVFRNGVKIADIQNGPTSYQTYTDTNLTSNRIYTYQILAVDHNGIESILCESINGKTEK